MKLVKFPEESNSGVINRAYNIVFQKHKIPESQQKEAKDWLFIRQEVSQFMANKVLGHTKPIKNRGFNPPREIIRLAFQQDLVPQLYHGKLKTSKQKFAYLSKLFLRKEINLSTFTEYAKVLDVKERQIKATITQSLKSLFEV